MPNAFAMAILCGFIGGICGAVLGGLLGLKSGQTKYLAYALIVSGVAIGFIKRMRMKRP